MNIIRALNNHNYRLYFGGQIVSLAGSWMQQIALAWLVYRLTDSTVMLGLTAFLGQAPILLLAPIGGVLSDRFPRRSLLVITQALAGLHALALALLAYSGHAQPPILIGMALLLGLINAIDQPVRQSFVPELVERREDIANAVALTSFTIHSSRFIGPTIGGLVVANFGEAACFAINATSYAAVIVALWAMRPKPVESVRHKVGDALREGFAYASAHGAIRLLLCIVATMAFFSTSYQTLLPYFAKNVYNGDAQAFGMMAAAGGLGACMGTIFLASRKSVDGIERTISKAVLIVAAALAVFALTHVFAIALISLVTIGFCSINTIAASNALIQSLVDNSMRGRVMAIFTMAFFGISPIGSLAVGWAAKTLGAQTTLLGCAAVIFTMGLIAWRARRGVDFTLPITSEPTTIPAKQEA